MNKHTPSQGEADVKEFRLRKYASDMLEVCRAACVYDDAIRACADDPDKMASFCTAQGKDLDDLYTDWMVKSRAIVACFSTIDEALIAMGEV